MNTTSQKIAISVIVPIYNMGKFLAQCLDSILDQTLNDIEVICINDGSTDDSLIILNRFFDRDKRIKIINQENQGVAISRNIGIKNARGEFLCFMDPDDWYPEMDILQTLYEKALEHNVNICGGSFSEYLPTGEVVTEFKGNEHKYQFKENGLIFYKYYQFDYGYHRFIYNTNLLKEYNIMFPLYIRFQDPPFFVKAMITSRKFYAVSKITYAYRVGHQKIQWTEKKMADLLRGLRDNLSYSNKFRLAELHQNTLRRIAINYRNNLTLIIPTASAEFIHLLKQIEVSIDTDLLLETDIKYSYNNIVQNVLSDAGCTSIGGDTYTYVFSDSEFNVPTVSYKTPKRAYDTIKVSIVIPVYNVEEYLTECLETIVEQTLEEIEIICVNDGSTDASKEIIQRFADLDERVLLIDKENGGLSSARNAGISHASGKYIYFIDSDDYLEQNALINLYNEAETGNLDIIYFDAIPLFESDESAFRHRYYSTYYLRNFSYDGVVLGQDLYVKMESNDDFRPSACLQFIRRKFLIDIGLKFYDGILHEDNLFTIQSILQAKRVSYANCPYYHRRLREGSIMTTPRTIKNAHGYFVTLIELMKFADRVKCNEAAKTCLWKRIMAIEKLLFDLYDQAVEKDMDMLLTDDNTKLMFDIILKTPYELILETRERTRRELYKKINDLSQRNNSLQYELSCVRNSISYKVGRVLTCIPRKARTLCRYFKKNGIHNTMDLIQEKLKLTKR